jgi:hypothetical protein
LAVAVTVVELPFANVPPPLTVPSAIADALVIPRIDRERRNAGGVSLIVGRVVKVDVIRRKVARAGIDRDGDVLR